MTIANILAQKGRNVVAVAASQTVDDIARLIASKKIGAVAVTDGEGRLIGIVSERDVVTALSRHGVRVLAMTAEHLMTRNPVTATPMTTVEEAIAIMDEGYFRHLPVLEDGKLAGIISIRDVVAYRTQLREREYEHMHRYVSRLES
jgi:CBS domain-containing protein